MAILYCRRRRPSGGLQARELVSLSVTRNNLFDSIEEDGKKKKKRITVEIRDNKNRCC